VQKSRHSLDFAHPSTDRAADDGGREIARDRQLDMALRILSEQLLSPAAHE